MNVRTIRGLIALSCFIFPSLSTSIIGNQICPTSTCFCSRQGRPIASAAQCQRNEVCLVDKNNYNFCLPVLGVTGICFYEHGCGCGEPENKNDKLTLGLICPQHTICGLSENESFECKNPSVKIDRLGQCEKGPCLCQTEDGYGHTFTTVCQKGEYCRGNSRTAFCEPQKIRVGEKCNDPMQCLCDTYSEPTPNTLVVSGGKYCGLIEKSLVEVEGFVKPGDFCLSENCICIFGDHILVVKWGFYCPDHKKKEPKEAAVEATTRFLSICRRPLGCLCLDEEGKAVSPPTLVPFEKTCGALNSLSVVVVSTYIRVGWYCGGSKSEKERCLCRGPNGNVLCDGNSYCFDEGTGPECRQVVEPSFDKCPQGPCTCPRHLVMLPNSREIEGGYKYECDKGEICLSNPAPDCVKEVIRHGKICDSRCVCASNPGKPAIRYAICIKGEVCLRDSAGATMVCAALAEAQVGSRSRQEPHLACGLTATQASNALLGQNVDFNGVVGCPEGTFCMRYQNQPVCVGKILSPGESCSRDLCLCPSLQTPRDWKSAAVCPTGSTCALVNGVPACATNILSPGTKCSGSDCFCGISEEARKAITPPEFKSPVPCASGSWCAESFSRAFCVHPTLANNLNHIAGPGGLACAASSGTDGIQIWKCPEKSTCRLGTSGNPYCEGPQTPVMAELGERCGNIQGGCQCKHPKDGKILVCSAGTTCVVETKLKFFESFRCKRSGLQYFRCPAGVSCFCNKEMTSVQTKDTFCLYRKSKTVREEEPKKGEYKLNWTIGDLTAIEKRKLNEALAAAKSAPKKKARRQLAILASRTKI